MPSEEYKEVIAEHNLDAHEAEKIIMGREFPRVALNDLAAFAFNGGKAHTNERLTHALRLATVAYTAFTGKELEPWPRIDHEVRDTILTFASKYLEEENLDYPLPDSCRAVWLKVRDAGEEQKEKAEELMLRDPELERDTADALAYSVIGVDMAKEELEEEETRTDEDDEPDEVEELAQHIVKLQDQVELEQSAKAECGKALAREQNVGRVLRARLIEAETKRLALRVAHGDLAADQFERQRLSLEQIVDGIIKTVREGPINS